MAEEGVEGNYLGLITKQLEGNWVRYFEGQRFEVEGCAVELEIDPHVLRKKWPASGQFGLLNLFVMCSICWLDRLPTKGLMGEGKKGLMPWQQGVWRSSSRKWGSRPPCEA